jgi:hypothetical protein
VPFASQELEAREEEQRRGGDLVMQIDINRIEQERGAAADAGAPREEAVGKAAAGVGGGDLAARVDGGREGVDAVVGGEALVAGEIAGAVALRAGEADVDIALQAQRRLRAGERRVAVLRLLGQRGAGAERDDERAPHGPIASPAKSSSGQDASRWVSVMR